MKQGNLRKLIKENCGLDLDFSGKENKNIGAWGLINEIAGCEDSNIDYFDQISKILIEFERKTSNLSERLDNLNLEKGKILKLMSQLDPCEKSSSFAITKITSDQTRTCKISLQGKEIQEHQIQELDFSQPLSLKFDINHQDICESTGQVRIEDFLLSKILDLEKDQINFKIVIASVDSKLKIKSEIKLSSDHKLNIINRKLEEIDKNYSSLNKNYAIFNEILDFCSIQYNNETETFYSSGSKSQHDRKSCCEECLVF